MRSGGDAPAPSAPSPWWESWREENKESPASPAAEGRVDPADPLSPQAPHQAGSRGLEPGTQHRQQCGFLLDRRAARTSPSLGLTSPHIPAPGRGRGRKEAVPEVGRLGPATLLPSVPPKVPPPSGRGQADHSLEGGWDRQQELPDLLSPWLSPCCRDLVSFHSASHPPRDGAPLGGASGTSRLRPRGDFSPGVGWCLSPHPSGHRRLGRPRTRTRGFSGSSPPTGGKGPRRPTAGRARDGAHRDPGRGAHLGDCGGSPLTGSPGPSGGAAPLQRNAASCGPARSRWRRQDAGRRRGPEGRAAGRRWAGPPPGLQGAGRGGLRARRGGGGACPGPAAASVNLAPSSEWPRPRLGGFICMSLACHLRSPPSHFAASRFSRSGF